MTWQKGVSGNQTGLSAQQLKRLRALEGLGFPAIARLKELIGSTNEQISLAACKEVLARIAPIPKTPLVALQVNQNSSPHLEALKALTMLPGRLSTYNPDDVPQKVPQIEAQPIDNIGSSSYVVLNANAGNEANAANANAESLTISETKVDYGEKE